MKYVVWGTVLMLLTAGLVYGLVAVRYEGEIAEADSRIEAKSAEFIELLSVPTTESPPPQTTPPPVTEIETDAEFCLTCHDKDQISSFHYLEEIKAFEEKLGKPIMICTTCHGEPVMPVHFKAIQRKDAKCEACHIC
jgi:hypothetical protein